MSLPSCGMSGIGGFALVAAFLGLGAAGDGKANRVAAGTWGGQGISLEVTEGGARIEYDCAHGTIDEPMKVDAAGRFEAKGHLFREHPGPIREGEGAKGEPVRYVGQLDGTTMTLTVRALDKDEPIGNYTLVHGRMGRIRKCG